MLVLCVLGAHVAAANLDAEKYSTRVGRGLSNLHKYSTHVADGSMTLQYQIQVKNI
jgi:hypothetical protein